MSNVHPAIKVLHILHAFSHGGLENGIVNIINGSPPEIEHELCLLTTAGEFMYRLQKPVRFYELHKQPGNNIKTILQLARVIRQSGADIVHTRNWGAFDGVLASCLCPGVILLHGEHGRDISDPSGLNRRRNLMRRCLSSRVWRFTAVSEDLMNWLSRTVRIPNSKLVLIRNGVDTRRFYPHKDADLRRAFGIREHDFVIGSIGRLDPVKNHAGLIRAMAMVACRRPAARLVIVGDGLQMPVLKDMGTSLLGERGIFLIGYREDVERFYNMFDLFVLNSIAEGMSNTLLEAMASGVAVVCTPVGANPQLLAGGERGWLLGNSTVPTLAATLIQAMDCTDLRHRFAECAQRFVQEHHSLDSMISLYNALYRSAVEEDGSQT